jgi:hypothetical protein
MLDTGDKIDKPGNQDNGESEDRWQKTDDGVQMPEVRVASVRKRVFIRLSDHQEIRVQDIRRSGNQDTFSTIVENPLQIGPVFMQNKANF